MIKIILIWVAIVAGPDGRPVGGTTKDATVFENKRECTEFAQQHEERMKDWMRGAMHVDWNFEVDIDFRCTEDGDPA